MDGKKVLVSNLTRGICVIDEEALSLINSFSIPKLPDEIHKGDENAAKVINQLYRDGILVNEDVDELKLLEKRLEILKTLKKRSSYTFILTYNCNLRCIYCYEEKSPLDMNWLTAQAIIDFIINRAMMRKDEKIDVMFYGGEPLLQKTLMEKILGSLENKLSKHNIQFTTGIITNGSLLTKEVVELLQHYHCQFIQITVDGPPEVHNRRRPMISGKKSFNPVIKGILNAVEKVPVHIRVNVDEDNFNDIPQLIDYFTSLGLDKRRSVNVDLARVTATTEADKHYHGYCIDPRLYDEKILKYLQQLKRNGFSSRLKAFKSYLFCGAYTERQFIIDCIGDIYTCLGGLRRKEFIVGNIFNKPPFYSTYGLWTRRSSLLFPQCRSCNILTFCGTGCADEAFAQNGSLNTVVCPTIRYSFEKQLAAYIHEKYKNRDQNIFE